MNYFQSQIELNLAEGIENFILYYLLENKHRTKIRMHSLRPNEIDKLKNFEYLVTNKIFPRFKEK